VTPEVTPQVERLLAVMHDEMSRQDIQDALKLTDPKHLRIGYVAPALELGLVEMTNPEKPRSSQQRYRLTAAGLKAKKKAR